MNKKKNYSKEMEDWIRKQPMREANGLSISDTIDTVLVRAEYPWWHIEKEIWWNSESEDWWYVDAKKTTDFCGPHRSKEQAEKALKENLPQ